MLGLIGYGSLSNGNGNAPASANALWHILIQKIIHHHAGTKRSSGNIFKDHSRAKSF